MPKIKLKPQSPEFDDFKPQTEVRQCDMPGCTRHGDHKAPKDRSLGEYYYFCFEHVREYNAAWDFFSGMNPKEVEDHIFSSMYGDRPTWRYDAFHNLEEQLARKAWGTRGAGEEKEEEFQTKQEIVSPYSPEYEALAIMGLEPPLTLEDIKTRYKELAKKHHPDRNNGDPRSEELLKKINMSYTVLKLAYQKFEKIEK